jgi:hypothetical protein
MPCRFEGLSAAAGWASSLEAPAGPRRRTGTAQPLIPKGLTLDVAHGTPRWQSLVELASDAAKDYLHRGIAARQFKRTFLLASGVEVRGAELNEGLLAVELVRPRKEKRVLKVGIAAAD